MSNQLKTQIANSVSQIIQAAYAEQNNEIMLGRRDRFDIVAMATQVGEMIGAACSESYDLAARSICHDLCQAMLDVHSSQIMTERLRDGLMEVASKSEWQARPMRGAFVQRVEGKAGGIRG